MLILWNSDMTRSDAAALRNDIIVCKDTSNGFWYDIDMRVSPSTKHQYISALYTR